MAELKTKKTEASVDDFLQTVRDESTRQDCFEIVKLMKQVTRSEPKMWGPSIVGFGSRRIQYPNGRELDWMLSGFSPRKANLTLYLPGGLEKKTDLLKKLGKHSTGKGCLYIKKLADVDMKVLKQLISDSIKNA